MQALLRELRSNRVSQVCVRGWQGLHSNRVTAACSRGWRHYCNFLDKYTWKAQAINTGCLMGTGDVIAQLVIERRPFKDYEKVRTLRFVGMGMCILGPSMFVWYTSLDRIVKGAMSIRTAVQNMLLDQTFFFPVYLASYISILGVLRGESLQEIKGKLRRDYKSSLLVSYKIWPIVMLGNFYFIPLKHRIFVMNLVGLIWSTIIGWIAEHKGEHGHGHVEVGRDVTAVEEPKEKKIAGVRLGKDKKVAYCDDGAK